MGSQSIGSREPLPHRVVVILGDRDRGVGTIAEWRPRQRADAAHRSPTIAVGAHSGSVTSASAASDASTHADPAGSAMTSFGPAAPKRAISHPASAPARLPTPA